MNIITDVNALSVKLMQPIRRFKNRLMLKYFTYPGLLQVSSWYHLVKQMQINGGSVSAFTSLPQNQQHHHTVHSHMIIHQGCAALPPPLSQFRAVFASG